MSNKYYFDTCIWRDHHEDRIGQKGRPLGKYATKLFMKIVKNKDVLLFSDLIIKELKINYNENKINKFLNVLFIVNILKRVEISEEDYKEAKIIGHERNLPTGDVLHAIIARNNNAILVSQDKHYQLLKDIVEVKKPEELI